MGYKLKSVRRHASSISELYKKVKSLVTWFLREFGKAGRVFRGKYIISRFILNRNIFFEFLFHPMASRRLSFSSKTVNTRLTTRLSMRKLYAYRCFRIFLLIKLNKINVFELNVSILSLDVKAWR